MSGCVLLQGTLTTIREWFRDYKIPDGKPANKFGFDNKAADKVRHLQVAVTKIITKTCIANLRYH